MVNRWRFITLLAASAVCLLLSVATVVVAHVNQGLQQKLQVQQAYINNSLLGPRGQQIRSGILQDMAAASLENPGLRALLTKYGYNVQGPAETNAQSIFPSRSSVSSRRLARIESPTMTAPARTAVATAAPASTARLIRQ